MSEIQGSSRLPLAIVTGAAHRIGLAIASELARGGYAIGLHFHHSEEQAQSARRALQAMDVPVFLAHADLTDPAQIEDVFGQAAAWGHPLKVLVNSAAVMDRGDVRTLSPESWDTTMALNLRAPWLCAVAAARLMAQVGGGVIVNITDSGAQRAWTGYPAYVVSKAALESLTRVLARALAPAVRVNAVAPGLILPSEDGTLEQWQRLVDRLPLREGGQPEDVARAVMFMVQNPYVTGQVLAVDGGYQLV